MKNKLTIEEFATSCRRSLLNKQNIKAHIKLGIFVALGEIADLMKEINGGQPFDEVVLNIKEKTGKLLYYLAIAGSNGGGLEPFEIVKEGIANNKYSFSEEQYLNMVQNQLLNILFSSDKTRIVPDIFTLAVFLIKLIKTADKTYSLERCFYDNHNSRHG